MVLPLIGSLFGRLAGSAVGRTVATLGAGALGAGLGELAFGHHGHEPTYKKYTVRKASEVVIDRETGEIIDYKVKRKRKNKPLPKYARDALKMQKELMERIVNIMDNIIIKEMVGGKK